MAQNDLSFHQAATLLNSIQSQVTGRAAITASDTSTFVQCATTTLKTGYDPVFNAVNQLLSRTIYSIRPYTAKFSGIRVSESVYGNHVRKLAVVDNSAVSDDRYAWPSTVDSSHSDNMNGNGQSVDQQVIRKNSILQTNLYGANVYSDYYTIFRDQLECAFSSPEELGRFWTMITQNHLDLLEQWREDSARVALINFIGGIIDEKDSARVVHLLSEYKTLCGDDTLTAQTIYKPENFKSFMQFAYARIGAVSQMMTERSVQYQTVLKNTPVSRHTPLSDQRCYVLTQSMKYAEAMALANTFKDSFVSQAKGSIDMEYVNFWQSIETPDKISAKPSYINAANGAVKVATANVEQAGIFAVLFDKDALGYAPTQSWSQPAPFNARGGYTTFWVHETEKVWNDHTEKGVVFLLD